MKVPWFNLSIWNEASDLTPQGDPETVVFLPSREHLEGLYIRGLETDLMLGVRTGEFGSPISCAITNEIALDIPVQSNPRRQADESYDPA